MWRLDRRLTAKERRKLYRRDNRFELLLGILAFLAGFTFFVQPDASTAAKQVLAGPLDGIWEAMYLLGGLAVAVGVARARILLEVPGLWLLSAAITVNAIAILGVRGPIIAAASLAPLIAAAWACLGRALDLQRHVRLLSRLDDQGDLPRRRTDETKTTLVVAPIALVLFTGAINYTPVIVVAVSAVLGGGLIGGLVAWARLRAEKPGIVQEATTRGVAALDEVLTRLEKENVRLNKQVDVLVKREDYLQQQNEHQQDEIDALHGQVADLTGRLRAFETR